MFVTERALKGLAKFDTIKDAVRRGELVYLMNQNDTDVSTELPRQVTDDMRDGRFDLDDGLCAGLATHWMACRHRSLDIPSRMVALETCPAFVGLPPSVPIASAAIAQAATNQNIMVGIARRSDTELLARVAVTMMGQYGIAVWRDGYSVRDNAVSANLLLDEMRHSGSGLYYVGMRTPDGGGHAIALERDDHFYRLFDGNTGSYKFNSYERFARFLPAYLDELAYDYVCTFQTWVAKVDLPQRRNYKDRVDDLLRRRSALDGHPQPRQLPDPSLGLFRRAGQSSRVHAFQ